MNEKRNCIDEIELAAYVDGRLPAGKRASVDLMLSKNEECRETLDIITSVVVGSGDATDGEPPERLVRKAIALYTRKSDVLDLVLSFAGNALSVLRAAFEVRVDFPFAAAALRNSGAANKGMLVMTKTFEAITAEVNIEKLAGRMCNILVAVQDAKTQRPMENLRVELVSQGRELGSSRLDQGKVLFEDVGLGRYDIIIRDNSAAFGTMAIKIV